MELEENKSAERKKGPVSIFNEIADKIKVECKNPSHDGRFRMEWKISIKGDNDILRQELCLIEYYNHLGEPETRLSIISFDDSGAVSKKALFCIGSGSGKLLNNEYDVKNDNSSSKEKWISGWNSYRYSNRADITRLLNLVNPFFEEDI